MPQNSNICVAVNGALTSSLDLEAVQSTLAKRLSVDLADGAGLGQAAQIFSDSRTLAASANENLDLNGSLTNAFGAVIAFTKIKALMVFASTANTNDVIVGGAASNGFVSPFGAANNTVAVKPGGCLVLVAPDAGGYAVTAATADLLKIANGGAGSAVTYDIVLIGA